MPEYGSFPKYSPGEYEQIVQYPQTTHPSMESPQDTIRTVALRRVQAKYSTSIQCLERDPVIVKIESGTNLFSYTDGAKLEDLSTFEYVSDGMESALKTWDLTNKHMTPPVLITAGTGAGKSWFILHDLASHADNCHKQVLFLSNRWALSLQQKLALHKNGEKPIYGTKILDGILQFGNVLIATYQDAYRNISRIRAMYPSGGGDEPIAFVVFDEVHFFSSDSIFNAETSLIFRTLLNTFAYSRRIYLSATPEDVKPLIALEEFRLRAVALVSNDNYNLLQARTEPSYILEFHFPANYASRVNLHFFGASKDKENRDDTWTDILETIKSDKSSDRWLIFVSNKEDGRYLKKELGSSTAAFVDASAKENKRTEIMDIARREMFEEKVLITTSFLYNGISFNDPQLKHIVVDYADRTSIIQALGRKRPDREEDGTDQVERINLYIKLKSRSELNKLKASAERQFKLTQEFLESPGQFLAHRWGNLPENQWGLFAPVPISNEIDWREESLLNALGDIERQIHQVRHQTPPYKEPADSQLQDKYERLCSLRDQYEYIIDAIRESVPATTYTQPQQQIVRFIMSDYAPHQLALLAGTYESIIDRMAKGEENAFQHTVCEWLGLEYQPTMEFSCIQQEKRDDDRQLQTEDLRSQIDACIERHNATAPMDEDAAFAFAQELYEITRSLKLKLRYQDKKADETDSQRKDRINRLNANINLILKHFSLPWKSRKANNKWSLVACNRSEEDPPTTEAHN